MQVNDLPDWVALDESTTAVYVTLNKNIPFTLILCSCRPGIKCGGLLWYTSKRDYGNQI